MSFSQWKRRFEPEQVSAAVPEASERAALIEVQLADEEQTRAPAGITVDLGRVHLRLGRDFDAEACSAPCRLCAMLGTDPTAKVYLAAGFTDLRKSIDGLAVLVADVLGADPMSHHWFAFCNRSRC